MIRQRVYRRANHVCEVCGGQGSQHSVQCHEEWAYDDERNVQRLERFIALCPDCHLVKHIGRARNIGRGPWARAHLARINGWTRAEVQRYIDAAFTQWRERSDYNWTLDLDRLREYGVDPDSLIKRSAEERTSQAATGIAAIQASEQAADASARDHVGPFPGYPDGPMIRMPEFGIPDTTGGPPS